MPPACPLCRGLACEPIHSAVPDFEHGLPKLSDFLVCRTCGLVFQWPQPSLAELESYYPSDYRPHVSGSRDGLLGYLKGIQSRMLARKYAGWLPRDRGARILDLGCGSGGFLMALRGLGYGELTGIDRNPSLAAAFDNVVEHFLDPLRVLERCREALAPGGLVLMMTPNADSWCHRFYGRYWSGLHAPRHPRIFNPGTLARLASQAGYGGAEVAFIGDPASWAFSLQNRIRSGAARQGVTRGTAWYSLASLPAWAPVAAVERMARRSSSIIAALRRDPAGAVR